jgi:DUF1680 family protein
MATTANPLRHYTPLPFTQVRLTDVFWAPRIRVNHEITLRAQYDQCQKTGRIDAFKLDWQPGQEPEPHLFWDSDVAKWIEAASYSLATTPDPALAALVESVVALVVSAQQPDGYLNVHFTIVEPEKRWTNLRDWHELYCAGHFIEAAVAHYQTTGQRTLLDAMCRYADYIASVFGTEPGKKRGYCGHEEIELALVKLYRITGEARYLRLSQYFIDERGRQPHYFTREALARGEAPQAFDFAYNQSHLPVREQQQVVGHAVRAMYLYSAMADLAGELGDADLLAACQRLWEDLCLKRLYLTGGIGPSRHNEGFTAAYDLPNETAYAETCAAIGLVFWSQRLLQLTGDARYADVMERVLYNGVLSGVSLDGQRFFYENPLASAGAHHRQDWFWCSCCPSNLSRLLASLGEYVYSHNAEEIAVHLYAQGEATLTLEHDIPVTLRQQTRYPWEGDVTIHLDPAAPVSCTLRLRIPGWCRQYAVTVNGTPVAAPLEHGYCCLTRTWQAGDCIHLDLQMPVERMAAHPAVAQDAGHVAIQRGPIVYCLEGADHPADVRQIHLPADAVFSTRFAPELLGGVVVIETEALIPDAACWQGTLYQPAAEQRYQPIHLTAIPYSTWDNRAAGEMTVWLPTVR